MQEEMLAEELPRQQSYLMFLINALGWRYTFLLPLAALVSVILVLVLITRGKGSSLPAALILIVPLPFLVGIMGVIDGMLASFQVIAASDTSPKPSEWAMGIAMSLMTAWVGILLSIPGFLLAVGGTFIRSLTEGGGS